MNVWTIGHSTQSGLDFIALLQAHDIRHVADVRRFPASRRHPQFNGAVLARALDGKGIGYSHLEVLGGRRAPVPGSANTGWSEPAFRGYADHMQTPAFAHAIDNLLGIAARQATTLLCAEKDWRDCHRGLVSDWLKLRGVAVLHILDANRVEAHAYTGPARIVGGNLSYAAPADAQSSFDFPD